MTKVDKSKICPDITGCTCVPFAALVLVMDKILAVLVDGVVCEMHADIILTDETDKGKLSYVWKRKRILNK